MSEDTQANASEDASSSGGKFGFLRIFTFGVPFVVVLILILAVAGGAGYAVYKYPEKFGLSIATGEDSGLQMEAADALIEKVGMLIELPDERPTIATVSNVEALRANQPFFEKAENGDRVLIYTGARKTIIYRESSNKIIDVGAVNIAEADGSIGQVESPTSEPTVEPTPEPTATASATPVSTATPAATVAPL
jgi:hypothetical protein